MNSNNIFKTCFQANTTTFTPSYRPDAINPIDAYDEVIYDGGEIILPEGVNDVTCKEN